MKTETMLYDHALLQLRQAAFQTARRGAYGYPYPTEEQARLWKAYRARYETASPELRAAGFDVAWVQFERFYHNWREQRA